MRGQFASLRPHSVTASRGAVRLNEPNISLVPEGCVRRHDPHSTSPAKTNRLPTMAGSKTKRRPTRCARPAGLPQMCPQPGAELGAAPATARRGAADELDVIAARSIGTTRRNSPTGRVRGVPATYKLQLDSCRAAADPADPEGLRRSRPVPAAAPLHRRNGQVARDDWLSGEKREL